MRSKSRVRWPHVDCDLLVAAPHDARIPEEIAPFTLRIGRTRGHTWEQRDLASFAGMHRAPLWSPGNTGPIRVARQLVTLHDLFPYRFPDYHSRSISYLVPNASSYVGAARSPFRSCLAIHPRRDRELARRCTGASRNCSRRGWSAISPDREGGVRADGAATRIATPICHDVGGGVPAQEFGAPRATPGIWFARQIKASNWYWPAGRSLGVFRVMPCPIAYGSSCRACVPLITSQKLTFRRFTARRWRW